MVTQVSMEESQGCEQQQAPVATLDAAALVEALCAQQPCERWFEQREVDAKVGFPEGSTSSLFTTRPWDQRPLGLKDKVVEELEKAGVFRQEGVSNPRREWWIAFVGKGNKKPAFCMHDEVHWIPRRVSEAETMGRALVGGTNRFHFASGEETEVVETTIMRQSLQVIEEDDGVSKAPANSCDRPFATRCYERVLSSTSSEGSGLEQMLLRDAELVDNPQEAQTFWLPAGCKPTTSLEKIAASIFDFHAKNLWCDQDRVNDRSLNTNLPAVGNEVREVTPHRGIKRPRLSRGGGDVKARDDCSDVETGAEWWVQIRTEGEHADLGMPFHWDKDEQLLERRGALVYPAVSTVTYLGDNGAPTVVFKLRATGKGAVVAGNMDQAFVSYPVLFKHIAFDGGFLHGVPQAMMRENSQTVDSCGRPVEVHSLSPEPDGLPEVSQPGVRVPTGVNKITDTRLPHNGYQRRMRVTLLVNVWLSHKPSGVAPLPRRIAGSLSRPSDVLELSFERPVEFHPVSVEGSKVTNNEGGLLETARGSTVTIEAPLGPTCYLAFHAPSSKRLSTGDCEGRHSFLLSFEKGARQVYELCERSNFKFGCCFGLVYAATCDAVAESLVVRRRSCKRATWRTIWFALTLATLPGGQYPAIPGMDGDSGILSDDMLHLAGVLRPCLGPLCKQYMLVTRTLNKVVITGSGHAVLKHTLKADQMLAASPVIRLSMASIDSHERAFGDGTASLVVMIAKGLQEAKKLTIGSPSKKQALSRGLMSIRYRWLDEIILPHLLSWSIGVERWPKSGPPAVDYEKLDVEKSDTGELSLEHMRRERESQCRQEALQSQTSAKGREECLPATKTVDTSDNAMPEAADCGGSENPIETSRVFAGGGQDRKIRGAEESSARQVEQFDEELDMDPYLDRMRAVLRTAACGLFSTKACHLLVDLVVNWFVSTAEQIYHQLDSPRHPMDSNGSRLHWDTSRQCLVEAGRYVHRHQATLLLGAKGASLGDSRIVDDGIILPNPPLGADLNKTGYLEAAIGRSLRFVILKCPMEHISSPENDHQGRMTIGISNAQQLDGLLRGRVSTMQAVVDTLKVNGIDLVVCTHPLKDPFPSLLREAGVVGLQRVENQDADYLAQRFDVRPFHRIVGSGAVFDAGVGGTVGFARGARRLCLGNDSNSPFFYVYGYSSPPRRQLYSERLSDRHRALSPLEGEGVTPIGLACQVMLRAPFDGILTEYKTCVRRLLALTLKWLEWDPPVIGRVMSNPRHINCVVSGAKLCPVVAGGGAFELSLSCLFRELAKMSKSCLGERDTGKDSNAGTATEKASAWGESPSPRRSSPTLETKEVLSYTGGIEEAAKAAFQSYTTVHNEMSMAFNVLATAVEVVPRALTENACIAPHHCEHESLNGKLGVSGPPFPRLRPDSLLTRLNAMEGRSSAASVVNMVAETEAAAAVGSSPTIDRHYHPRVPTKGQPIPSLSCGLAMGVVHPLAAKFGALVAFLDVVIAALRVSGVVACIGRFDRGPIEGEGGEDGDANEVET